MCASAVTTDPSLDGINAPSGRTGIPRAASLEGYAAYRQRRHFGSLDGLRALSVVAVIWHHTLGHQSGLPTALSQGAHGVTLFFAISGFLIVTLLLRERDRDGRVDLRAFYVRRSLRIFPLYFAVLAIYVLAVALLERNSPAGREFFANLIFFVTYTSNWFVHLDGRVIFYFAWSLAAEEQFYLVWPSVERFVPRRFAVGLMLLAIAVLTAFAALYSTGSSGSEPLWRRIVAGVPFAICFGVVLAHALHHPRSHATFAKVLGWRGSSVFFLGLALAVLSRPEAPEVMIHLSMALLVGACVCTENHWLSYLLKWRVVAYLGSISYGMYLLHMLVKNVVVKLLFATTGSSQPYAVFVLTLIGTVAVATLSFRYFESYFLKLKDARWKRN
jgi:peptidoglycan/LPS O-acetylase OafA/YrhL